MCTNWKAQILHKHFYLAVIALNRQFLVLSQLHWLAVSSFAGEQRRMSRCSLAFCWNIMSSMRQCPSEVGVMVWVAFSVRSCKRGLDCELIRMCEIAHLQVQCESEAWHLLR